MSDRSALAKGKNAPAFPVHLNAIVRLYCLALRYEGHLSFLLQQMYEPSGATGPNDDKVGILDHTYSPDVHLERNPCL